MKERGKGIERETDRGIERERERRGWMGKGGRGTDRWACVDRSGENACGLGLCLCVFVCVQYILLRC